MTRCAWTAIALLILSPSVGGDQSTVSETPSSPDTSPPDVIACSPPPPNESDRPPIRGIRLSDNQVVLDREIAARNVPVARVSKQGFWVETACAGVALFVRPAEGTLIKVTPGERVSLHGEFRVRPNRMRRDDDDGRGLIYLYAYTVRPAG